MRTKYFLLLILAAALLLLLVSKPRFAEEQVAVANVGSELEDISPLLDQTIQASNDTNQSEPVSGQVSLRKPPDHILE